MNPRKIVPLIATSDLDQVRAFYVDKLGFSVTFDAPSFLGLRCGNEVELSFMIHGDTCTPFSGGGLSLCLEVENVDAEHDRLRNTGVSIVQEPKDNPWGDRSFVALDPLGVSVYVYQPIEPSPEFEPFIKE